MARRNRGVGRGGQRWRERWHGQRCAAPGCAKRAAAGHHVVYEQHLKRHGGRIFDPANCLPLCFACHQAHHSRSRVLPVSVLDDGHVAFAYDLMGEAALDYLRRYYRDDRPGRLEGLWLVRVADPLNPSPEGARGPLLRAWRPVRGGA